MSFTFAAILPCFVLKETNRRCARIPGSQKPPGETSMMMNQLRDHSNSAVETSNSPKIVAAFLVALGFGAIGMYTYETGTWNSQPKQILASKETPSPAPVASAAPSEAPSQSAADLPPAPPPAAVKDIPAQPVKEVAAQKAPAVRVARAQAPAPESPQIPAAQASPNISAPATLEIAAPAANIPEPPAAQNTVTAPADTPAQAAPPQEAPAQATPPSGP